MEEKIRALIKKYTNLNTNAEIRYECDPLSRERTSALIIISENIINDLISLLEEDE